MVGGGGGISHRNLAIHADHLPHHIVRSPRAQPCLPPSLSPPRPSRDSPPSLLHSSGRRSGDIDLMVRPKIFYCFGGGPKEREERHRPRARPAHDNCDGGGAGEGTPQLQNDCRGGASGRGRTDGRGLSAFLPCSCFYSRRFSTAHFNNWSISDMNCAYASSFDCFCCCCWACWKGPPWCCGCCGGLKTSVMGSLCRCFFASFTFVGTKRVTSVRRFLKMSPAHLTICEVRTRVRKFPPPPPHLPHQAAHALLGISAEESTLISRNLVGGSPSHESITKK